MFLKFKTLPFFLCFLALLAFNCASKKPNQSTKENQEKPQQTDSFETVTFVFAGDVMMHLPQIEAAETDSGGYDFTTVFQYVKPFIESAGIAVANLETTFGGKPYTGYPQFSAPDTLAWFLKNAGFDVMVTANNHSADRGLNGINKTIEVLDRYQFPHTGTFKDSTEKAANHPLYVEKNGLKIAFLNYTYGTNGLPVPAPSIVNPIDTQQIKEDLRKAATNAHFVIPIFHWGLEYELQPNKEQKRIAKFTLENGADFIIGGHPHVLQPAVYDSFTRDSVKRAGLVMYSLGNFISNQRKPHTDGGTLFFVKVRRNKFSGKKEILEARFLPTWVYIERKDGKKNYYILPAAQFEKDSSGFIPATDLETLNTFLSHSRKHLTDSASNILEYEIK